MRQLSWIAKKIGDIKFNRLNLTEEEKNIIELMVNASHMYSVATFPVYKKMFPDLIQNILDCKLISFYDDLCYVACLFLCVNSVHKSEIRNKQQIINGLFLKLSDTQTHTDINALDYLFGIRKFIDSLSEENDFETCIGLWILTGLYDSSHDVKLAQIIGEKKYAKDIGDLMAREFYNAWDMTNK
jgi:hypothetical protein